MANKGTVEVLIKLKNQASKALTKVNTAFKKTSKEVDKTGKEFKSLGTDAKKGLAGVEKAAKKTTASMKGLSGATKNTSQSAGVLNASTIALAGSIYLLARATREMISAFVSFDDTMRTVGAVSNATTGQLEQLTNVARKMGATTRFTATQAADGLEFLARAGFSVEEALGALPGTLQLAAAGSIELGRAADIATNILTGFSRDVSELGNVNDVLVKTFTSTNVNLEELGEAFKLVAPIATAVGSDFNDLAASIGLLGNAGLKGTIAGTSLRGALGALLNPTDQEAELMKMLAERIGGVGLEIMDTEGNFVGFLGIVKQLEKANITGAEALELFGLRAGPGMAALVGQGSAALEGLVNDLDNADGTAARVAKAMEAGLGGALRELKSAVESLAISMGTYLEPRLIGLVKVSTEAARGLNKMDLVGKTLIEFFSTIIGLTIAWNFGIRRLISIGAAFLGTLKAWGAASLVITNIWRTGLVGAIIFATYELGRLALALVRIRKETKKTEKLIASYTDFWGDNTEALKHNIQSIEELRELSDEAFAEEGEALKASLKGWTLLLAEKRKNGESTVKEQKRIKTLRKAMEDFATVKFSTPTDEIKKLGEATKETAEHFKKAFSTALEVSNEFYTQSIFRAKEASAQGIITKEEEVRQILSLEVMKFDEMFRLAQEYAQKAKEVDELTEQDHAKIIELMKTSVKGLEDARIKSLQRYSDALKKLGEEEKNSISLTNEFRNALKDLTDKNLEADDKLKSDKKEINKLQREANKLIKEGGEDNLKLAEEKLKSAQKLANALDKEVKVKGEIIQTEEEGRKDAIKETKQNISLSKKLGAERIKNAEEAIVKEKLLADTIGETLKSVKTQLDALVNEKRVAKIEVEIDAASLAKVEAEFKAIEATPLIKKIKYVTEGKPSDSGEAASGYATGGSVHGAGGVDNVPAWLSAGEFVLKKSTVKKLGLPFLTALNGMNIDGLMGNLRTNFATGGFVGGASSLGQLSFTRLMRFANGGSTEALAAEKGRISRDYDEQIAEATLRGDEDKVFALKEEKIALRELADELKKQLEELNEQFTEQLNEQKTNLESLKVMQKKYSPFGNALSLTTGMGVKFKPILSKTSEQVKAEIPVVKANIVDLTAQNDANIKATKISHKIKVDEVKLNTEKTLTDIDRQTQDAIRRLEEERFDALSDVGTNSISGSSSGLRRQFFADGGKVSGADGTDNVPAFLTNGEYVLRKSVADGLGKPFLDNLNNFRIPVPRFAEGGSVGSVASSRPGKNFGTVQLAIGNKSFSVQGEEGELSGLVQTLKEAGQRI